MDDNKDSTVVIKSTQDLGRNWTSHLQLSPNADGVTGFSSGFGFAINGNAVVQFVQVGNTAPAVNIHYWQVTASERNMSHWSAPVEVTSQLRHCSPAGDGNMMVPSDGSKAFSGNRFFNPMHDHAGNGVVAFTDDGGRSWNCSQSFRANEISVAPNPRGEAGSQLYMNGRGNAGNFAPYRSEYFSGDNGLSWRGPLKSALLGDEGCERSLRADASGRLFSCEPTGHKRKDMKCECSTDGGRTWPYTTAVNDSALGDHSGYSDLWIVGDTVLLVMENNKDGNIYSHEFSASFCGP
jgi:hypothetical protein